MFCETELNEFFVFLSNRRILSPGDAGEKLKSIVAQLIKLIVFDVKQAVFFEVFEYTARGEDDELILEGHR